MSLVKFTELPAGSIQGGDVLAVAGASSYKVTATELANWTNKRIQGGTTSTVEYVETKAIANKATLDNLVMPQLGQISTNKADIKLIKQDQVDVGLYSRDTRRKIYHLAESSRDNLPSMIAAMIKDDNYIKNPAAHNIALYWNEQTDSTVIPQLIASDFAQKNLEYPGWSRTGDLLTYNFTVALDGKLTIGQLGGTNPEALEYRVNGGTWVAVGGKGIVTIGVGYAGVTSAGAQISVRMHKDSNGIAFAIASPVYWLTDRLVVAPTLYDDLVKLTYGLRRNRIDLEACGYWFAPCGKISNGEYAINKSPMIGKVANTIVCGYDIGKTVVNITPHWIDPNNKITLKVTSAMRDVSYIFGATDPDLYTQAEVY